MKKFKLILNLFVLTTTFNIIYGSQCTQDYQCGTYPYAACNGALNLGYGIAYNSNNKNLIVSGKYNSSDYGPFGYPYIFDLSTNVNNGSEATLETKNKISGEILYPGAGFTTFYKIYQYAPIHNYLYITFYQAGSNIYAMYDQATSTIKQILNIWGIPFTVGINKEETMTVFGEYGIYLINTIPKERSDFLNATVLYQNQITNGIILDGKDIYISTYDGKFYLGNTDCRNCTQDKLKLIYTDSSAQTSTGFLKVNDMIYYSNEGGIKGFSTQGDHPVQLTNDSISSMTTDGEKIYYITTGTTTSSFTNNGVVKSVTLPTPSSESNKPTLIYTPKSDNQCQCAVGFTGDKCEKCDGKVLWFNGIPQCTPINPVTGYPETCYTSQDCSNSQFINCNSNSHCECLPGFTATKNDCICSNGEVVWTQGYPSCVNHTSTQ
ncbi:hypothetical protein DICPUDRAFT_53342 [Dictyostelium purpureum]|uniref:EGF-like domain-containing protein n=1 Tax=Dictyostelium purpureum TaxID=5786 RepID=F0ZCC8_DICPU|nr:uncharacterized protein DICPUDRAFT_53342 [Dictyostelium purpureum]EGC38399.1 hypothetical protein DICPUDRAFT_53342 [Dictyostelium purpureum]|eukprot:XP_003285060.1 hypothetical protein DICPUDRAFT_53342 [Dictyostelium purpureum]